MINEYKSWNKKGKELVKGSKIRVNEDYGRKLVRSSVGISCSKNGLIEREKAEEVCLCEER